MNALHMLGAARAPAANFASFEVPGWVWAAFVGAIAVLLVTDVLLVHRSPHDISPRSAAVESTVWIAIGLSFTFVILAWQGGTAASEYLSGYLIEKSLSVDNVFVWAVIFGYFGVPNRYQFRVLFWGIFGALVLRAVFIFAGVALLETFNWVLYLFGAFLLVTAFRVARHKETEVHPEHNPVLRIVRRVVPSTNDYDGQKLFTRRTGRLLATPLFAVLVLTETTDIVFAVDSIPAILAVSREPFIVFASNAFAILGLRALYFLLAGMADRFRYLNIGLGAILAFVGLKMLAVELVHLPTWLSLGVIAVILAVTIMASLRAERRDATGPEPASTSVTTPSAATSAATRETTTMQRRPILAFGDDGSPAADVCWLWINSHAWPGWRLEVITAQEAPMGPPPTPEEATLHHWDPPAPRVPFTESAFGEVAHLAAQINPRLALGRPADLTVIGPRGPGLLKALHLGSTAEWLLQHPVAPLVIARSGHPVRTVVACHDGSPRAQRAVQCLANLPWIGGVEVTILVVDDGRVDVENASAAGRRELERIGMQPGILNLHGKPTAAIFEAIEQLTPDLVALGTSGLTGMARLHHGSTAGAVARAARCSVLLTGAEPPAPPSPPEA